MSFVTWLKSMLCDSCEEERRELSKCLEIRQKQSEALESARNKIKSLEWKVGALENGLKTREKLIEDLKSRLDSLTTWQDEPASSVPDWLLNNGKSYKGRRESREKGKVVSVALNPADLYFPRESLIRLVASKGWRNLPHDQKLMAIWAYVIKRVSYRYDAKENWQEPNITNDLRYGDCFAWYEEIYTKDGIKKIKDIKEGDLVLTYDFDRKKFIYKPVVKHWYKGKLQVNRVHFRNGTWIDVSENHPMWIRYTQKESKYEKKYLSEVDLTRWWKRKVPIAKKLPREIIDKQEITEDLAFVIGYFLAEGSIDKTGRISLSGHEMAENILPILDRHGFSYSERYNNSGVLEIRLSESWFTKILREFSSYDDNLSFSAKIPEWVFNLPDNKLEMIIEGYKLGDGTKNVGANQYNKEYVISTSSYELAMDLQRIALHLGFSFHIWKQENHGSAGKRPIYRLTRNKNSHFLKDYGYDNISEVSISHIEKLGEVDMYDITVADTHTVIMRNGIITHQCEDGTILFVTLSRIAGVPADKVFNALGNVYTKTGKVAFGHSWPIAQMSDGKWYIFESTLDFVPSKPMPFIGSLYSAEWGVHNWKYDGIIKPDKAYIRKVGNAKLVQI